MSVLQGPYLGVGVVGSGEIWRVIFTKASATVLRKGVIIVEDAACAKIRHVHAPAGAHVRECEAADDVGADCLCFMCLTPVDVWTAGQTSCVEHMRRLDLLCLHAVRTRNAARRVEGAAFIRHIMQRVK